jgi:Ca-activated chloride channel family protein
VPVAPGSFESAAIVLLTDGRRTTGVETQEAAMMAANHGVRVYSIGLGTVDGEVPGMEGWSMYLQVWTRPQPEGRGAGHAGRVLLREQCRGA